MKLVLERLECARFQTGHDIILHYFYSPSLSHTLSFSLSLIPSFFFLTLLTRPTYIYIAFLSFNGLLLLHRILQLSFSFPQALSHMYLHILILLSAINPSYACVPTTTTTSTSYCYCFPFKETAHPLPLLSQFVTVEYKKKTQLENIVQLVQGASQTYTFSYDLT